MAYTLYHEISHHFIDTGNEALNEALADDKACKRFFDDPEGDWLTFVVVARKIIEANMFE